MINQLSTLILVTFSLAFVSSTCDFSSAFCASSGVTCPSSGNIITAGGNSYNLGDIDVISFNDLTLNNGDIQNRVAVRNNFYASNGVSVGDQLTDGCGYAIIVGGDLIWADNGAVYPLTSTFFVGGSFTGPSYFQNNIASCASTGQSSGCLGSYFDGLFNYWSQFSSSLAAQSATAQFSISSGIATLTCSSDASNYYVNIASSDFNQIIGYATANCSASANWVFNLNGAISFNGNPIQVQGAVIYNIAGASEVTVVSSVNGNIVAPSANINMVGGTITGHVIAGNFSNIIQVNTPVNCPTGAVASRSSFCTGNSAPVVPSTTGAAAVVPSTTGAAAAVDSSTTGQTVVVASTTGAVNPGSAVNGQSPSSNDNNSGAATLTASCLIGLFVAALI